MHGTGDCRHHRPHLAEVQRYIAEADRVRLARNATVKLRAVE
jgi:hypothetical protein